MPPTVAEQAKPLTAAEKKLLDNLLQRSGQAAAPAAPGVRTGDPYVALTNIVVPRRNDKDHGADLVPAGETVYLTEDEAKLFLRCDPGKDGRRIPVIRRKDDGEAAERYARTVPRQLSGVLHAPPPPVPGSDGPRPDPPGSSTITYNEAARVPEMAEPQPGTENTSPGVVDAMDIPPRGRG